MVPPIPGLADSSYLTNDTFYNQTELPRRFAVIGSGPIGASCRLADSCEFRWPQKLHLQADLASMGIFVWIQPACWPCAGLSKGPPAMPGGHAAHACTSTRTNGHLDEIAESTLRKVLRSNDGAAASEWQVHTAGWKVIIDTCFGRDLGLWETTTKVINELLRPHVALQAWRWHNAWRALARRPP